MAGFLLKSLQTHPVRLPKLCTVLAHFRKDCLSFEQRERDREKVESPRGTLSLSLSLSLGQKQTSDGELPEFGT